MSTFLFGGCACGGCNFGEEQIVVSMVPFYMGYKGLAAGAVLLNPITITGEIVRTIYLTYTCTYLDGDTNEIVGKGGVAYATDGTYELFGDQGWPDWVVNRACLQDVSDPYTYDQAVTNAMALLANVTLLNPTATYAVKAQPYGFNFGDPPPTLSYHFCYPSEGSAYVAPYTDGGVTYSVTFATSILVVYYDTMGGTGYGIPSLSEGTIPGIVQYLVSHSAQYGACSVGLLLDGIPNQGWVICQKSAVRTPTGFVLSVTSNVFGGGSQLTMTPSPGEFLLLPSDVGEYGIRTWYEQGNAWQAKSTVGSGNAGVGAGDTNSDL